MQSDKHEIPDPSVKQRIDYPSKLSQAKTIQYLHNFRKHVLNTTSMYSLIILSRFISEGLILGPLWIHDAPSDCQRP